MPNIVDFSKLTGHGELKIELPKWKNLTIEYAYGYINNLLAWYWRIKGTTHTFWLSYQQLLTQTDGIFDEHIKEFLQNFREEYLSWAYAGFKEKWMREYHEQYKHFIEL